MNETLEALAVSMASAAVKHGNALIAAGKISESASWSGPSAGAENAYLDDEGLASFGRWYMGRQSDAEPDTKAHFRYPFSSDFKTISENGLKAIRSRSAQNDETQIFDAAGKMLDAIAKKRGLTVAPAQNEITFRGQQAAVALQVGPGLADLDRGEMYDVNILTTGTARGHQMMISDRTLTTAMSLLAGASLPAYLTHNDSAGDRLLTEAGIFSGFYLDGQQIKARQFKALDAFREYEPEKFSRLFEMANAAPELFGVSIVFDGRLFWETEDGDADFSIRDEKPENTLYSLPTIEPTTISSADFVDQPAANPSLFSAAEVDSGALLEDMNATPETLSAESASHQSDAKAPAPAKDPEKPVAIEEPKPKKKAKKALAEPTTAPPPVETLDDDVAPALDASSTAPEPTAEEAEQLAELTEAAEVFEDDVEIDSAPNEIDELRDHIQTLRDRITELEKLHIGPEPIEETEETAEPTTAEQLAALIDAHILANPKDCRSTAVLAVGKAHPELFTLNNN